MKKALSIAGFDPSGGAGLQADLKVFQYLNVYGLSVASSLTAQNTAGVYGIIPVRRDFIKKQLTVLLRDMMPDATKLGMLHSESVVTAVSDILRKYAIKNVVVDPVMSSSSGRRLADSKTASVMRERLLPFSTLVTPNLYEASVLSGIRVKNVKDMERASEILWKLGPEYVLITGGHLEQTAVDILYDGNFHYLRSRKIPGEYHGTGCLFSAAITAFLAHGFSVGEAVKKAKKFMNRAFRSTFPAGGALRLFHI